jgi:multiple sugar transport system substrate-binding protein
MTKRGHWTRRHLLGASVGVLAGALGAGSLRSALAAPAIQKGSKITFWGGLIFSDAANKLLVDTINKWGADNGVTTEVVMINQNETVQKVSAAVSANSMPDALDVGLDLALLLSRQGQFLVLDDIYESIGSSQGGWYDAVAKATDTSKVAGGRTGIPFGVSGNLLLRRDDVLTAAGFKDPPKTWEELSKQGAAVNKPPLFGLGLALSNVGDGNVQVNVLQSYGGRIADDTGTKAAIKSEETRTYLKWVKDAWDQKLFPPGNTTWDGAGDNQAYLAGQAAFIANTGSVGIAAKKQDPELFAATKYSSLPGGPKGVISPIQPQLRVIPKAGKNTDTAKALVEFLAQPEFLQAYYAEAIYGPVTKNQKQFPVFNGEDAIHAGLLDLVEKGTAPAYPDVYNAAFADMSNNFLVPKMVQRVVIDGWDADKAMDEAQTQIQAIYDKYK